MTAIKEMAGMDVLCSDKTGNLTLNKLTVDKNIIEVFSKSQDSVILMAARASRTENQDAIDTSIVGMLADPIEVDENICKFAKKGLSPSQIGIILRDLHSIVQVKSFDGSKIFCILKAHDI